MMFNFGIEDAWPVGTVQVEPLPAPASRVWAIVIKDVSYLVWPDGEIERVKGE